MIEFARGCLIAALFGVLPLAHAGVATVAVATNFLVPAKAIAAQFERETQHTLKLSFGATGQFYAQIVRGAPFDVLLAADQTTPDKLAQQGLGIEATKFAYANGKLVLWSKMPGLVDQQGAVLSSEQFDRLAIADPKLAPYGRAALEVLQHMGLSKSFQDRLVQGKNIGQAYQFVASGNAQLGFVALSQVYSQGQIKEGSAWLVPTDFYQPIEQDAILLARGANNEAAKAFLRFLKTDKIRALIRSFGYEN